MIVLGIDSGVERTGYSVFEKSLNRAGNFKYLTSGLIKTSAAKSRDKRLEQIYNDLLKIIKRYKANIIVLEQLFFFKNQKTAIQVSQSQGVCLLLAAQNNLKTEYLTPLQIKQIVTGYGKADKKAVQKMLKLTLKTNKLIKQDDEADAIACGMAYCLLNKNLM